MNGESMSEKRKEKKETAVEIKLDEMVPVENMSEQLRGAVFEETEGQEEDGSYTVDDKENEREYPDDNVKDTTEVGEYNPDAIQVLEGLEAVRKRPGMYIGTTSSRGLHHLVYEIVDNAVDEALAGFCTEITVIIHPDNSITVMDNGRGIPVGINHKTGRNAVDLVFTELHAGGKFGGGGYKVSGGLHGVGASVVNALSEWLEVEIRQNGRIYRERFSRGKTTLPLEEIGTCPLDDTGTIVTFLPDSLMFTETTVFEYDVLRQRMREMAFLTRGLRITLKDEREDHIHTPQEQSFCYEGGIREFVTYLNHHKNALYDTVMYFEGTKNNVYVEVAMQHNDSYTDSEYSFVNNINTPEGGMHLVGFRNAVTKTFNEYARKNKILKDSDQNLTGEDMPRRKNGKTGKKSSTQTIMRTTFGRHNCFYSHSTPCTFYLPDQSSSTRTSMHAGHRFMPSSCIPSSQICSQDGH